MKTFIVTADVISTTGREAVIHCITSPCADRAELSLRQQYPDAVRVRAINCRDADKRLASIATALSATALEIQS